MYRRRFFIVFSIIILIVVVLTWYRFDQLDGSREIVHETNRWAVIEDIDGNHIAVEPTDNDVWNTLVELNQNKTRLWIGGKLKNMGTNGDSVLNLKVLLSPKSRLKGYRARFSLLVMT